MVVSVLEGTLRELGKVEIQPIDTKKLPRVISLFLARPGSIHPMGYYEIILVHMLCTREIKLAGWKSELHSRSPRLWYLD